MNRFFHLIACAFVVILIASCAPIPDVVPKGAYVSHSGRPPSHRPGGSWTAAKHRVRHAADHELRPWNDLPVTLDTEATGSIPTSPRTLLTSGGAEREDGSTTKPARLGLPRH